MRLPQCIYMMQYNFKNCIFLPYDKFKPWYWISNLILWSLPIITRFSLIYRIDIEKINTIRVRKNLFKFCLFCNHCYRHWLWLHLVRTINFVSVLVDCQKYLGTNNTYLAAQTTTTTKVHIINSFMRHIPCHLWYLRSIQF